MTRLLKTAEKRLFVEALESFSPASLAENLVANGKEERNKVLMKSLSYNRFSRSKDHAEIVKKLREGQLKSWNAQIEELITKGKKDETCLFKALHLMSQRPGVLLRSAIRMYRLGISENLLLEYFDKEAIETLSFQTLISNMNYFYQDVEVELKINANLVLEQRKSEFDFARHFFKTLLNRKLKTLETPLKNKKVYVDEGMYDFAHSIMEMNNKQNDDTYIRSGMAFKIPETVKHLRFFVYWNDEKNIDIDLHADAYDNTKEPIHIGYYTLYANEQGLTFSGDIRHSDAAEYIDIDMKKATDTGVIGVVNNINIYSGANSFKDIETVFTGMMAVDSIEKDIQLYNGENVFFRHDLNSLQRDVPYAYINIPNRYLRLRGKKDIMTSFMLSDLLSLLYMSQNVILVGDKEVADIILTLDKPYDQEKGISLLDQHFFLLEDL